MDTKFYPIEHGVPIPPVTVGGCRINPDTIRPWDALEIGDSFLVPNTTPNREASSMHMAEKRRPDKKFTMRRVGNDVRIWRIDPADKWNPSTKRPKDAANPTPPKRKYIKRSPRWGHLRDVL